LWQIIIYTGKTTDMASGDVSTETLKITQMVVILVQPLFNLRHTLWMDSYYNFPDLCLQQGVNVAGTLRLNRKNVPEAVKQAKLKKGELVAFHSKGVMVLKWMDKKSVAFISTFHDATMVSTIKCRKSAYRITTNQRKGIDLKDKKLQPYAVE
jgi:hypothetical protein